MATATFLPSPVRSTGRRAGRWRFSVDDYVRLHERGIIPEDGRYMDATVRTPSEVVAPLSLPAIVIEVGDVLRSES